MTSSSISTRLLNFVVLIVGRVRGGLAYVNIIVSIIFAGMSGSALADAAGPGKLMIDMMTRNDRYPRSFAGALTAASATIGPIIPPSIPMVIYGAISGTPRSAALFLAGIIPGLLMGLALAIQTFIVARRRDFPVEDTFTMPEARRATLRAGTGAAAACDPARRHLFAAPSRRRKLLRWRRSTPSSWRSSSAT